VRGRDDEVRQLIAGRRGVAVAFHACGAAQARQTRPRGETWALVRNLPGDHFHGAATAAKDGRMPAVRHFDHIGVTVADLDSAIAFFTGLGLVLEGRTFIEGEFIDTVIGIPDSRTEIAMLHAPDGGTGLELSSFVRPDAVPGRRDARANELGLRSIAFEVDDLRAVLDWAAGEGYGLDGGVGEYEGIWKMAYVRGPEGIIVALAERIG
jgi:catechol 2,3-dioxygenase-like lactoylglutathione lyase family enzyme